ncbi:hypothetical protein FKM82_023185 [Ascaphus truei]
MLEPLHHIVLLADHVVLEQGVGLHLRVLDLQLVHFAQEAQHLPLLLRAYAPGKHLLQPPGLVTDVLKPLLQLQLQDSGPQQWEALSNQ